MKAMILAAGEGRRLRPLTDHTPKPMLPIAGRPLLEHVIINLRACGITEMAINLYHLPQAVVDYFGDGDRWQVNLHYSIEERLLGSAGGVKRMQTFLDETFVVYYGDVLTWADLRPLLAFHRSSGAAATMGLYSVPDPWNRGIVQLDDRQRIIRFAEKPARHQVFSNLANAGVYVLEPSVFDYIPANQPYDFGHDVFPAMLTDSVNIFGYTLTDPIIDIGLPEKYREANELAQTLQPQSIAA